MAIKARVTGTITGVEKVTANLNKEINKIVNLSMKGLIKAAVLIRRDMDKTPPVIPVDLGNLRASSFVVAGSTVRTSGAFKGPDAAKLSSDHNAMISSEKGKTSGKKLVAIGFSAFYASEVEEDTTKKRKRPGSGGKFFESSLNRNAKKIVKVLKKEAKIK